MMPVLPISSPDNRYISSTTGWVSTMPAYPSGKLCAIAATRNVHSPVRGSCHRVLLEGREPMFGSRGLSNGRSSHGISNVLRRWTKSVSSYSPGCGAPVRTSGLVEKNVSTTAPPSDFASVRRYPAGR